jgi:SAM-dependent methyltransferase
MAWSLEHSYTEYPAVEAQFEEALDESLAPRGPDFLFELVAGMGLPPGARAVDVGCGEGRQAVALAERFGLSVAGIDPVQRHIDVSRVEARESPGVEFRLGSVEALPVPDRSVDLVWCRDVLVHVADLGRAYRELARVLKPGGRVLVYQMFGTELLEPREAGWLFATMGVVPGSAEPANTEAAIATAGLLLDRTVEISSEWGEQAQELGGKSGRKLLHAARLRRQERIFKERYGEAAYELMMGDCFWHVYAMIGKLTRRVYLLTKPLP